MKTYMALFAVQERERFFHAAVFVAAAAVFLALSLVQITGCTTTPGKQGAGPAPVTESAERAGPADSVREWGIMVTSVRLSANNHMVDFRYRVLDAEKAGTLFSKETRPYLIHQQTGKVLSVPRTAKVGPLMSTYQHQQGRIYWMFFGNPGNLVKAGDEVSVVIGAFRADQLIVE